MRIISVVTSFLLLSLTFSCKKEESKVHPTLTTSAFNCTTSTTATGGGIITSDGGSAVTARGVCWSLNQSPTISDNKTSDGTGIGSFSSSIVGLSLGKTYYVRAYAINSVGTGYGNEIVLNVNSELPTIITTTVSELSNVSVLSGGKITSDGGAPVIARGVCWSTENNPTIEGNRTNDSLGTENFTSLIKGLIPDTKYYIKAYAINKTGTSYGNIISFNTLASSTQSEFKPTGCVQATSEELQKIPKFESINIFSIPVLKSESLQPDRYIMTPTPGSQDNLECCTGYSVGYGMMSILYRSIEGYDNFIGLQNGKDRIFSPNYIWNQLNNGINQGISIPSALELIKNEGCCKLKDMELTVGIKEQPSVEAKNNAANYKLTDYYIVGGTLTTIKYILSAGYPIVICALIDNAFKREDLDKLPDGSLVWKKYSGIVSKLTQKYPHAMLLVGYNDALKAFKVLNSWGNRMNNGYFWLDYEFGKESIVELYAGIVKRPLLETASINDKTSSSAKCGGIVTFDWSYPIISRGVCWSTSQEPTINDYKTTDGSGPGSYTSTLLGLDPNKQYYVRAYATNINGVSYGQQIGFSTMPAAALATLTTSPATNITNTSATLGGIITSDGNASITERGVVYSTSPNPTIFNTKAPSASGANTFSVNVSGLTTNVDYYARAYAINSAGTAYGNPEISFTTGLPPVAAFSATPNTITAGQSVQFTDQSTNTPTSWSWNFGDGGTSTSRNPTHIYASAGSYTVTLTSTNSFGSNTQTKTNYITVNIAGSSPVAAFIGTPTTITAGESVQFTDQSTNTPTSWNWNFGDGTTSTIRNPSNTYITPGNYTVSLTATNSFGSDTETKINYITVNSAGNNLSKDLYGYWPFDGNTNDESGNSNNGAGYNAFSYVSGIKGNAIRFVGSSTNFGITNSGGHLLLPFINFGQFSAFSISLWVKEESMTWWHGTGYISFGDERGYVGIQHNAPDGSINKTYISFSVGKIQNAYKIEWNTSYLNQWIMLTLVYEGGNVYAYKNGVLLGSKGQTLDNGNIKGGMACHYFGQNYNYFVSRFTGSIDDVRIYSKALTPSEVFELFQLR